MLKFEQVDGMINVKSGNLLIGSIRKASENSYRISIPVTLYATFAPTWGEVKNIFNSTKAAQDAITAKWNEWLDKAGLQVKQ